MHLRTDPDETESGSSHCLKKKVAMARTYGRLHLARKVTTGRMHHERTAEYPTTPPNNTCTSTQPGPEATPLLESRRGGLLFAIFPALMFRETRRHIANGRCVRNWT